MGGTSAEFAVGSSQVAADQVDAAQSCTFEAAARVGWSSSSPSVGSTGPADYWNLSSQTVAGHKTGFADGSSCENGHLLLSVVRLPKRW